MNKLFRRDFFKKTGLALLASGISLPKTTLIAAMPEIAPTLRKASRLCTGATVALIAPCSPPSDDKLANAIRNLTMLGLRVVEGKSLRSRLGYLAGDDDTRLADLHWAFRDPAIDVVWCVRGGYGAGRLLPRIDFSLIRQHPKPFIGYSDVTALHLAIHSRTGLVTFHGPVAASDMPENTLHHLRSVLMEGADRHVIAAPVADFPGEEFRPFTITPGNARGGLTGGNISLLSSLVGTAFAPVFRDKIVFIEDVGEQPYRLDRMLTQLLQGSDLSRAAGIALGVFSDCQPKPDSPSQSLPEMLRERLGHLGIPVVYGLPFGHVSYQATLPYGIEAALDATNQKLTLLSPAVH
jgi:muramoyltetrapeptide carboxypeptidase